MAEYKEEEIARKLANKINNFSPYNKLRKGKKKKQLEVVLPYKKGDKILNQRSGFFKSEYSKESLLSWS